MHRNFEFVVVLLVACRRAVILVLFSHEMHVTKSMGSLLPCYMILSLFRSSSSVSFSGSMLEVEEAPQICISISASRFSRSHCCWDSLAFKAWFSDSTVCNRSLSLFTSSSKASCDPNKGVAPPPAAIVLPLHSRCVMDDVP